MAFPTVKVFESYAATASEDFDAVILLGDFSRPVPEDFSEFVAQAKRLDKRVGQEPLLVPADVAGGRLMLAPTGSLVQDYADVRALGDAAGAAARIVQQAGATAPLVVLFGIPNDERYNQAEAVAYWGICQALYEPLEAREFHGDDTLETVTTVGMIGALDDDWLQAVEAGKRVARDLAGTEPERMAPRRFAEYCQQTFAHTPVKVTVIDDLQQLQHEYPLFMAVARASINVERPQPCVVR